MFPGFFSFPLTGLGKHPSPSHALLPVWLFRPNLVPDRVVAELSFCADQLCVGLCSLWFSGAGLPPQLDGAGPYLVF